MQVTAVVCQRPYNHTAENQIPHDAAEELCRVPNEQQHVSAMAKEFFSNKFVILVHQVDCCFHFEWTHIY